MIKIECTAEEKEKIIFAMVNGSCDFCIATPELCASDRLCTDAVNDSVEWVIKEDKDE